MDEISLRHIPDLSDADLSDSSFQIPAAARNSDDLLADDTTDFFGYANDALNTPAPPSRPPVHPPLTLAELTPRSKPVRTAPARSSLRPGPGIATPHRAAVVYELSTALSEDLTAFREQTPCLEIPESKTSDDLLMADSGANFLGAGDACVAEPSYQLRPDQRMPPAVERAVSETDNRMHRDVVADRIECLSAATAVIPSTVSESVPEGGGDGNAGVLAKKGKSKALPATDHVARHKKLLGGDTSRRKRVLSSAAITKPAKLKPSTATLARRLSNSSKKTISAVRRRPLPSSSSSSHAVGHGASALEDASQPFCGSLADTLLSFGQRLAADANKLTQGGKTGDEPKESVVPDPEPEFLPKADHPPAASADHRTGAHHAGADADPGYLTLSQLSPQKAGIIEQSPSAMLDSHVEQAPAPVLDHPHTAIVSSDRSPSPMRSSMKRMGSPANESETRSRKRSKTTSGSTGPNTFKGTTLQPSRARNAPAASVGSGPSRARRVASVTVSSATGNRAARVDGARKPRNTASRSVSNPGREGGLAASKGAVDSALAFSCKGVRNAASSTGNGRSGHHSDRENLHDGQGHPTNSHNPGRSTSTTGDRPLADSHPAKAVKPTKPKEFQFATSSRSQARSGKPELDKSAGGGGSLRRSHANVHPIPDFKALHAAQESVLAQKRAEIQVTKPVEFDLATVSRAQERERYEEERRGRERELERQAEERRRQRELEEEAEIRELRRRAVPKANEVPEWYAFAPKKSKADANAGS